MKSSFGRPQIVVIGAGFGGLNAAPPLRRTEADVTVIGQHNHHIFQPLYYQVASASLSPDQIATPIRQILSRQKNTTVLMDSVADLAGTSRPPFVYKNYGNLATIGRKAAVADFGRIQLKAFPAWIVWGIAHVGFLIGFCSRATVMLDWVWSCVTYSRGARLIIGDDA